VEPIPELNLVAEGVFVLKLHVASGVVESVFGSLLRLGEVRRDPSEIKIGPRSRVALGRLRRCVG